MSNELRSFYDLPRSKRGRVGDGARVGFWEAVRRGFWAPSGIAGRASRSEFWYFWLFGICCNLASLALLVGVFDLSILDRIVSLLVSGLILTVQIRRLHDVNRSGWWVLISVTVVGLIPLLIWSLRKGDPQPNRFDIDRDVAPTASDPTAALEQVARLHQLRTSGAISEEEFLALKARVL